eukprot:3491925-Lingulodinium_polyedra.AAC.1
MVLEECVEVQEKLQEVEQRLGALEESGGEESSASSDRSAPEGGSTQEEDDADPEDLIEEETR